MSDKALPSLDGEAVFQRIVEALPPEKRAELDLDISRTKLRIKLGYKTYAVCNTIREAVKKGKRLRADVLEELTRVVDHPI